MSDYSLSQKCMAEALGTFMIIGGGCGMVCAVRYAKYPTGPLVIPVVFGLAVGMAVYATRDVSGAHLNPAITAAFAVNRPEACPKEIVLPYDGSQIVGATVAGALNYLIYNRGIKDWEASQKIIRGTMGSCSSFDGAFGMVPNSLFCPKSWMVLAIECGVTAALAFTIFALVDNEKTVPSGAAPALIGATVTGLCAQFAALTGCGMNPARDLGPRFVTALCGWGKEACSRAWWAYSVGPVAGAILGGAMYDYTIRKRKKEGKY